MFLVYICSQINSKSQKVRNIATKFEIEDLYGNNGFGERNCIIGCMRFFGGGGGGFCIPQYLSIYVLSCCIHNNVLYSVMSEVLCMYLGNCRMLLIFR